MFYNPFAKKEKRKSSKKIIKPKIFADIHEKDSSILAELISNKEIETKIISLKIGDYLIGNTIVERKTTSDFISSMLNKRLIQQLVQMQKYKNKLLIIEGNPENLTSQEGKLNPNALRGFILSIIQNYNTNIIFTKDPIDTSLYLITLTKQQSKKPIEISFHSRIPRTTKEQKQYILESFPNIGPKKAKLLLKKFKTLKNTFNACEEDIRNILKGKSKEFKDILNNP